MDIKFTISDDEAKCIAEMHGFDDKSKANIEDFVNETFKSFGRSCIVAQASLLASKASEQTRSDAIDLAKKNLSF